MSGHSKWATIKRAKGVNDAKRGAVFTKIGNMITVAAREKGADPEINFVLRMAMEKARAANMPKDNIERAIKRGTGELAGEQISELMYEGIGPANSQFIIRSLTDNKNRSAATIRHAFTKFGGSLGSVMWNFEQKGVIRVAADSLKEAGVDFDELELGLIDAGAQDIQKETEGVTVITEMNDMQKVNKHLEDMKIKSESAELEYVCKDEMVLNAEDKEKVEKFIEALEETEDVSDYYTNVNI
jgi:YebC/PmpR family DNA-binding regulatory protein